MKWAEKVWKLGRVTASSPVILLIHGNKFCKEIWIPVVEHLSRLCAAANQSAEVVAVDLPGCGDSRPIDFEIPADWISIITHGIRKVAEAHSSGSCPLFGVGHSLGATLVMACEAEYPGTFTRILAYEPGISKPGKYIPHSLLTEEQIKEVMKRNHLLHAVLRQPKMFNSREEAFQFHRSVKRFALVPNDVIKVYIQHGFEDVPDIPGHVAVKQDPEIEADRIVGRRVLDVNDVSTMHAPCIFAYGTKSDYGKLLAEMDISDWIVYLAKQFSKGLGPPWEVVGATHMLPLEKVEIAACHIQHLVWYKPASAHTTVQSKL